MNNEDISSADQAEDHSQEGRRLKSPRAEVRLQPLWFFPKQIPDLSQHLADNAPQGFYATRYTSPFLQSVAIQPGDINQPVLFDFWSESKEKVSSH